MINVMCTYSVAPLLVFWIYDLHRNEFSVFSDLNMPCCYIYLWSVPDWVLHGISYVPLYINLLLYIPPAGCQCLDVIYVHRYLLSSVSGHVYVCPRAWIAIWISWMAIIYIYSHTHTNKPAAMLFLPYICVHIHIFRHYPVWPCWICINLYL